MADLSGERLGPFEIRSLIGTGGFATVYRAHDPRLGTEVALKILAENHSLDPTIRERFLGEANALRRVDSPSVIRIYDIRETPDARPYLVLEFADRGDLVGRRRSHTANGWSPNAADVRSLVEAMAEALDAVHAEDLVHRDITPSNVLIRSGRRTTARPGVTLIEPDERFILSDMGLVKDLSAGSSLTVGGGTAGFWAPEQQQAMASVDNRTDIYSVSALLVWLLTGETVTANPTWDDALRSEGWPTQVVTELLRGLALDPADRHQTIRDWEATLMVALAESAPGPTFEAPAASVEAQPHQAQHASPPAAAVAPTVVGQTPTAPDSLGPGSVASGAVAAPLVASGEVKQQRSGRSGALFAGAGLAAALVLGLLVFLLFRGGSEEPAQGDVTTESSTNAPPTSDTTDSETGASQSDEAEEAPEQAVAPKEAAVVERTVDTWGLATHGNGSQLIVEQIVVSADRTTVRMLAINGRDFNSRFDANDRTTRLVDDAGSIYGLLDDKTITLDHGETERFELDFAPLAGDAASVTVEFNVREDDEQSIDEGSPGFSAIVDLVNPAPTPSLPEPVLINDVAVHPNSSTIRISGLAFSDTNIAAGVTATNGSGRRVSFSAGHQASYLEDDLGNRYWLKFEFDERFIRVDEGFEATGLLVFAGRIHPQAQTLQLVLNHEESPNSDSTGTPRIDAGPWPIDGSFVGAGSVDTIEIQEGQTHPNTVELTVDTIEFEPTIGRVSIDVVNNRRTQIYLNSCCDNSYLLDDLDNRYLLFGLGFNDDLQVPGGEQLDGAVLFIGAIDPAATTIQVILNDRDEGGLEDPDTARPQFAFGPYDITRSPAELPLGFDPTDFGTTSTWEITRAE